MVLSRNSQVAIAVAGVIALGLIVYLFGIPREAGQRAQRDLPVVATDVPGRGAPAAPTTTGDRPSGDEPKDDTANGEATRGGAVQNPEAGKAQQHAEAQPAAPQAPAASQPVVPSFDIVRVEPSGEAVIAGRAAPNGKVELLRNGEPFAEASTDAAGQFAMTPPALPAGTFELTLRLTDAEGRTQHSGQSVTVVVADDKKQQPMVALATPNAPTQVLSRPETTVAQAPSVAPQNAQQGVQETPPARPAGDGADQVQPPAGAAPAAPGTGTPATADSPAAGQATERVGVAIDAVDVEGGGRLFVSGRGAPGATVRLYLNDSYLAAGDVPADGRLSFSVERGVAPGDYRVRLDDVDPGTGAVLSRAEVPFTMPGPEAAVAVSTAPAAQGAAAPTGPASPEVSSVPAGQGEVAPAEAARPAGGEAVVVVPEVRTAVVSRGDSLWRISRRIYGHGIRYTVIYDANQEQIRNPDLIYPGQVFVLPNGDARR
ncbi:LysM domain [Chelatococcus sambhunathii]|uniref:LysM domain-containing protein n=2 Tax=Chelatococcus TaxID=28209 RepID=A0AAC9JQP7_9HYPH|nr:MULTISPECIES: LysM peptidoglycan-binding domain-containing protein [Chelatococcus]APF37135.1 hypothetical protein BOQ54_07150 [Chelatococcus daeguensis]CUA87796.1 LysM domain [Chelatococcus sambhunathii]